MTKFKKVMKVILKVFLVIILVVLICAAGVWGAVKYLRWRADVNENGGGSGIISILTPEKEKEENVRILLMGVNGTLTDFIMLAQYNPNTREIKLLSIPRDTKVSGTVDGKINAAYLGKYPEKTMQKVTEITGLGINYYVVFDTKILREIVDEIGGVTVDVPINMNYDDPYQNLYIHLKKGNQTLTGKQAEQFVRFRKNNDGTGYSNGDIGRIAAQQEFIKALIAQVLTPQNLLKVNKLINIILDETKTDITLSIAMNYVDDIATFKTEKVDMNTLPGYGGYAENGLSYYFHNEEETEKLVKEMFLGE